jgi:transcriptional regulator with XRE-family HTH domain
MVKVDAPGRELEAVIGPRLREAGRFLAARRRPYSQADLAGFSGVGERTIRRIEAGIPADLASYVAIGDTLGLPAHWFLSEEILGLAPGSDQEVEAVDAAVRGAGVSGLLGPEAIGLLRACFELSRDDRIAGRARLERLAAGWHDQLTRARDRPGQRA